MSFTTIKTKSNRLPGGKSTVSVLKLYEQYISQKDYGHRLKHHQIFLDKFIFILIFLCYISSVNCLPKNSSSSSSSSNVVSLPLTTNSSVNSLNYNAANNESYNKFNNSILVGGNSVYDILNDFSEIIRSSDNYNDDEYFESFSKHKPKPTIYLNEFAVHIPAGEAMADQVARSHGFTNMGQVSYLSFSFHSCY